MERTTTITSRANNTALEAPKRIVDIDLEAYLPLLEDDDVTDEEKLELLRVLWAIISEFVALGFGIHPVQQAQAACGKPHKAYSGADLSVPSALYLDHQVISENLAEVVESVSVTTGKGVEV